MEMRADVRAASGIGDGGGVKNRTKIRREDHKRRGRRGRTGGDVTKNALMRDRQRIGRDAVFKLVDRQRDLRQQQKRRNPGKQAAAPRHFKHRTSSSAMPFNSEK